VNAQAPGGARAAPWAARAAGAALALAAALAPARAAARATAVVSHPAADVWATAVRFLRVDRGFPIREKDEAAGYVLFDYAEGGKAYRGALELIPAVDGDGRNVTQLVFSLTDLPRHFETALLDRLTAKVREERGTPPPPRRRPPAAADGPDKEREKDKDRDRERDRGSKPAGEGGAPGLPRAPGAGG